MAELPQYFSEQLKQACKLTNARWSAWLVRDSNAWRLGPQHGLNKARLQAMHRFMEYGQNSSWLAGALTSGRTRWKKNTEFAEIMGCECLFTFASPDAKGLIVTGADQLSLEAQGFFRILALNYPHQEATPAVPEEPPLPVISDRLLNPEEMFHMVLRGLIDVTGKDVGFLALRWGDVFHVHAAAGYDPAILGKEIHVLVSPSLADILIEKRGVIHNGPIESEACLFQVYWSQRIASWMSLPILVGNQAIGVVVLVSSLQEGFTTADLQSASQFLLRAAHAVDYAAAIDEILRHLERATILNELSLAEAQESVSRYANLVVQKLRDAFSSDLCRLYLRSPEDGEWVRYQNPGIPGAETVSFPVGPASVFEHGKVLQVHKGDPLLKELDLYPGIHSVLYISLNYRSECPGFLILGSEADDFYSVRDEHLLETIITAVARTIHLLFVIEGRNARVKILSLIPEIIRQISQLSDNTQIMSMAAKLFDEYFNFDAVWIQYTDLLRVSSLMQTIWLIKKVGFSEDYQELVFHKLPETVLKTGKGSLIQNLSDYHPVNDEQKKLDGGLVCLPLNAIQGLLGVLCLYKHNEYDLSPADVAVLEALADIIGSAITNADQYHDLKISLAQLQAVQDITMDITGEMDLPVLFNRIVHRARESIQADGALLGMVDADQRLVHVLASENTLLDEKYPTIALGQDVVGKVAVAGETILVDNYPLWDGRFLPAECYDFSSALGIPLIWNGKVIGVLEVMLRAQAQKFSQDDINLLQLLAPNIAIAIHNAQIHQELMDRMAAQQNAENQALQSAKLAALGQMAAGVAHEINNPLTTIAGYVELALLNLPEGAPQRGDLQIVLSEAYRAKGVVRRLLDFSYRRDNIRAEMNINQVVGAVIPLIEHQAHTGGVRLEVFTTDDLPLVKMNAEEMKEVVLNLVQNALDAMPDGGKLALLTDSQVIEGKNWVKVVVSDTGEGISEDDLGRIFEPFFTRRQVGKGTGLGLAVCYGLITNHGGRIDVQSQVGQGSRFTVLLPVGDK